MPILIAANLPHPPHPLARRHLARRPRSRPLAPAPASPRP